MKKLLTAFSLILFFQICKAETSTGELELTNSTQQQKLALLLNTEISGEVNGMLANITVTQSFKNESNDWVNGRYVFPLPEGAAVDSLKIEIGERVIEGVIKEKQDAIKTFEHAKRQGKKAGLLQQHRPNLFSVAVANIGPHEEIVATITFIDTVHYENDSFSLTLPTTLTPRYIPNAPIQLNTEQQTHLENELKTTQNVQINAGGGWANNNARVDDASNITPPQTYRVGGKTSHHFSLDLSINSGLDLQGISSSSHAITSKLDNRELNVSLANGLAPMNADLKLHWKPIVGTAPKAAIFQQQFQGDHFTMVMLTPPSVNASLSLPKDITFIVDSSGSMAGQSMLQAKQALLDALNYLTPSDRFNIIDFDSSFNSLYSTSQAVSSNTLSQARNMITGLHADGGTEMLGALNFALRNNNHRTTSNQQAYLRQIIFITDGSIGNERELFELISKELGDTRLFTVGIGSAPNSFFMSKAAKFGRGSYTYISDVNQVQQQMADLFTKITKPVLRDLKIDWPTSVEQYPSRLPDLYAGEPITILLKSDTAISSANIQGSMLNTPWSQTLNISNAENTNSENLDTVWARHKVADLMDKYRTAELSKSQVKPEVTQLGIRHQILTQFTAFVAVEQEPSRPELTKAKHKDVANLMPKGSAMRAPNTATPATLLSLLGAIMILLGGVLRRLACRKSSSANGFGGMEA